MQCVKSKPHITVSSKQYNAQAISLRADGLFLWPRLNAKAEAMSIQKRTNTNQVETVITLQKLQKELQLSSNNTDKMYVYDKNGVIIIL